MAACGSIVRNTSFYLKEPETAYATRNESPGVAFSPIQHPTILGGMRSAENEHDAQPLYNLFYVVALRAHLRSLATVGDANILPLAVAWL